VYAAQLLGVSPGEAPGAMPGMFAAKFLVRRRITARPGPVAHGSQFGGGKQLQLPHAQIIPESDLKRRPTGCR
jgi:hypothetical protein